MHVSTTKKVVDRDNLLCFLLYFVFSLTMSGGDASPKDFNECVSRSQLQTALDEAVRSITAILAPINHSLEGLDRRMST